MTMHSKADSFLAKNGVTCDQYVLLHILSSKKAITEETLAARATLDPSAVERLLVVLEGRGIVARQWCLTNKGHGIYRRLSRRRRARKASASKKALDHLVARHPRMGENTPVAAIVFRNTAG
jgi:DNA-binding MarR family transcriptional regulator